MYCVSRTLGENILIYFYIPANVKSVLLLSDLPMAKSRSSDWAWIELFSKSKKKKKDWQIYWNCFSNVSRFSSPHVHASKQIEQMPPDVTEKTFEECQNQTKSAYSLLITFKCDWNDFFKDFGRRESSLLEKSRRGKLFCTLNCFMTSAS